MSYEDYIKQLVEEEINKNRSGESPYKNFRNTVNKIDSYGNKMTKAGDMLNQFNSPKVQSLGNKLSTYGNQLSGGASKVNNVLDYPKNFAYGKVKNVGSNIKNAITTPSQQILPVFSGVNGSGAGVGTVEGAINSEVAGTGATSSALGGAIADATSTGATAGTIAGTTGGTVAGTTAAGGTAAGAAGSTAGGTAASGAAAGGAAAGPIGALIALGVMALEGSNRRRAKNAGQALLAETMKRTNPENYMQNASYLTPIYENALNNSYEGITGEAAPLQGQVSQNNVQVQQPGQVPIQTPEPQQAPQQVQSSGMLGNLINGISDFSRGYQENLNNAFNPNNLSANQFTETINPDNTKLVDYQAQLTSQGIAPEVVNAVAQGKNSGNVDIDNWIKANPDAFAQTKTYDKGKMARLGELAGTISRFSQKPGVQALLAGGISTALTGNPMYGIGMAYKFGNQRANNDIYNQALKKYGITTNNGFFNTVGPKDLNAIGNLYYKDLLDIYRNKQLAEKADFHEKSIEQKVRANDIKENLGTEKNKIDRYKAEHKGGGNGGGKGTNPVPTGSINEKNLSNYQKDMNIITPLREKVLSGEASPEEKQKYAAMAGELRRRYGNNFYSKGLSSQKSTKKTSSGQKKLFEAPGL